MNKFVFNDVEVSKKQFYESKIAVKLSSVAVYKIVVTNKIKENNETSKIFIGYIDHIDVILLCIVLPQMSGWIKYFGDCGKNLSFKIEDYELYLKYNEIWNGIKKLLGGLKSYCEPTYDDSYIKTKVKTFSEVIKTLFDGDKIPKEKIEYTCIPCISIDSVLNIGGENYPHVYLEQCKYKVKKREIKGFIDYEIELDSDSHLLFLNVFLFLNNLKQSKQ